MNTTNGEGRMNGRIKEFHIAWNRSADKWNDPRRKEFEKEYVEEMQIISSKSRIALAELSEILGTIVKKCS